MKSVNNKGENARQAVVLTSNHLRRDGMSDAKLLSYGVLYG